MLQYFKKGWEHRAVWGDYEAIQWGAAGTAERVNQGPLPEWASGLLWKCQPKSLLGSGR